MSYIHPKTKNIINGFNSHEEHCFYEETTKREMFLIIEQFATLLKKDHQTWVQKAQEERQILKKNNIK